METRMTAAAAETLLAELKQLEEFARVPDEELRWMIERGYVLTFQPGERVFSTGDSIERMTVVLEGRIKVWMERNGERQEMMRLEAGEITGKLPYSRMRGATSNGEVVEFCRIFALGSEHFPEMIRTQYYLTEALVHVMTNRVRSMTAFQQQNEKLISLGKLSAGLSHELNNPAAAVVRSAEELKKHLGLMPEGFKRVISIRMEDAQVDAVNDVLFSALQREAKPLSGMARFRAEECLIDWFDDQGVDNAQEYAEVLLEFGLTDEDLDFILQQTGEREFLPVLGWVVNVLTTEKFVNEIREAARRIADLVQSVKSYTYMDQVRDRQHVDVREGIRSTYTMLKHKFKKRSIEFIETFAEDLPAVSGFPGELNQVWTNLMDNALDAMEEGGTLEVQAHPDGNCVRVRVIDSGKGIPPDVLSKIWDPFFTTKPLGQGTGLGLGVVHRIIVQQHKGTIEVAESRPGRTVFELYLPVE
ncbi:MAG: ATP-binding protein [Bacteroidia bacterium]|nr:ATP-binding protein [Bacteroidia bacterium]